jgi:adenylate cyclase
MFQVISNFIIKMAAEIERKFMVRGEFRHLAIKKTRIIQTYLSVDPDKTIRIRAAGRKAFITIKNRPKGRSFIRDEWEFQIPFADAMEIMKISLPGKIDKTRYLVPVGKHMFEVDEFHDKNEGLVIAEIELASESEKFEKPEWLGEEVTGRPEYYNANLIK